jgi:hypothetical protein
MWASLIAATVASGGIMFGNDPIVTILTTSAVDVGTRKPVYIEERKQLDAPDRLGTWHFTYRDVEGKTIVQRQVDFAKSTVKPSFRLEDLRNGYAEGAELVGDKIRVFAGGSADKPYRERLLKVPEPAVVDAGFNFFVEKHWDALMKGEVLTFNFVAPSQLDYFRFRVSKSRDITHAQRQAVFLKMEVDQPFLRLFVDPIQLTYDKATRKLLVYDGISNISDGKGKTHRVRMEFNP